MEFTKLNVKIVIVFLNSKVPNADGIHKIKCKDCNCFLEFESAKCNLIKYKCPSCN